MSTVRFAALFLLFVVAAECGTLMETCDPDLCVANEKCEIPINGAFCPSKSQTCCSIIKEPYRTLCRHHGGECMERCAMTLQRPAIDCKAGTICCVLV